MPWDLAVFAGIAIVAGNTWYVFHRYSLHQAIDWLIYITTRRSEGGYVKWLANHLYRGFHTKPEDRKLQDFVSFRSAQVIFMFITCEVALLFCVGAEPGTFYHTHRCWIGTAAAFGLLVSSVQYFISNNLDVYTVDRCTPETSRVMPGNPS
jgi:hypothetical protein